MTKIENTLRNVLPLIPAFAIYVFLTSQLDFIQDDAYITFRYIENYLNGDGLVFNIGERIEGFTNFGWTIYLLFWGANGFDYIFIAKYSGLLFGALSLVLVYLIGLEVIEKRHQLFAVVPVYLVAINQSFAYWSPAGLETAAFTFLALLSLFLFIRKSNLLIASLALAVWVRPEGALVAIILILIELIQEKRLPKYALVSSVIAFVISIPFLVFKVAYYGSILPNPFFAKTGFDLEQIYSGIEYVGQFFWHYGFLGVPFVIAILLYKKLSSGLKTVLIFSIVYICYIVFIGGDVLKVHRFFLPIFGPAAILLIAVLSILFENLRKKTKYLALMVFTVPLLGLTYYLPSEHVAHYNFYEKVFVEKMAFISREMRRTDSRNFSAAISTIGMFGYELVGHDVIDVLGLTDSTIARHSQENVEGITTTWKERKFNVDYLLKRAPDYILFSTGSKPSAPAEKYLCMHPAFFMSYNPIPWSRREAGRIMGVPIVAFKKVRPIDTTLKTVYPIDYVEYMKTALEYFPKQRFDSALIYIDSAILVSPKPVNPYVIYEKAFCLAKTMQYDKAEPILDSIIARDSLFLFAHRDLYLFAIFHQDANKAAIHERWIRTLAPWYWNEIRETVEMQLRRNRQSR